MDCHVVLLSCMKPPTLQKLQFMLQRLVSRSDAICGAVRAHDVVARRGSALNLR